MATIEQEARPIEHGETIDFSQEATVAYWLNRNSQGEYIFPNGESATGFVRQFSLMKHGSLPAVRQIGATLAQEALADERFIDFVSDTHSPVYISSPGIYNVPSASNLLLADVATRINSVLSRHGVAAPLIMKPLTRLGEGDLHYANQSLADRGTKTSSVTLMPAEFRDVRVVYLDDIYISGTVLRRNKARLYQEAGVERAYFLLGAHMDQEVVRSTDGKIEDELNRFAVDGSLSGGIIDVLQADFSPVQKTLRVVLDPRNVGELQTTFTNNFTPDRYSQVLKSIYTASGGNDFWHRYDGRYRPALEHISHELTKRGLLTAQGMLID